MKKFVILFIFVFIITFLVYEFLILRKYKDNKKNKKLKNKYPMEVLLLINLYKLDISKLNYKKLLHFISLVSSIDISLIITIAGIFDMGLIQIIIALIIVIPVILGSYYMIYLYYKKKYKL